VRHTVGTRTAKGKPKQGMVSIAAITPDAFSSYSGHDPSKITSTTSDNRNVFSAHDIYSCQRNVNTFANRTTSSILGTGSYSDSHYSDKRYVTDACSCGNNITVWLRRSQRCKLSLFRTLSLTLTVTLYVGIRSLGIGTAPSICCTFWNRQPLEMGKEMCTKSVAK